MIRILAGMVLGVIVLYATPSLPAAFLVGMLLVGAHFHGWSDGFDAGAYAATLEAETEEEGWA